MRPDGARLEAKQVLVAVRALSSGSGTSRLLVPMEDGTIVESVTVGNEFLAFRWSLTNRSECLWPFGCEDAQILPRIAGLIDDFDARRPGQADGLIQVDW